MFKSRRKPNCVAGLLAFFLSIFALLLFPKTGAWATECYSLGMPQVALPGIEYVAGQAIQPPAANVQIPACNHVTLTPSISVRPEDVGENGTLLLYFYIPSINKGYLVPPVKTKLENQQVLHLFHTTLDLSSLVGLKGIIYFGYTTEDNHLIYNSYAFEVTEPLTNDYEPPSGEAHLDQEEGGGSVGPWNLRLRIAESRDGLEFTKTDRILTDQADVADLVVDENGWIYAYFVGWTMGDKQNRIGVAISYDKGEHWIYKYVNFDNISLDPGQGPPPVDPDVVILPDGTFRLFITYDKDNSLIPQTYYAEGMDGINFSLKGKAFGPNDITVFDPSVVKIGDTWHLYAWALHGTSNDGKSFTPAQQLQLELSGGNWAIIANVIPVEGGYRAYGYSPQQMNSIYSFFTEDGDTWEMEPGSRLTLEADSMESDLVKEPAVVQLKDGTYLMIYSTAIP